jgi:hypothetical protein
MPNKNFKQDKIQLAFCSLRSPILANYILPLKWALSYLNNYEQTQTLDSR